MYIYMYINLYSKRDAKIYTKMDRIIDAKMDKIAYN
jgi:hypothetical protein